METTISAENLAVLRDSAFEIPKARQEGDFRAYLGDQFNCFFKQTERFGGQFADRLAKRLHLMRELSRTLEPLGLSASRANPVFMESDFALILFSLSHFLTANRCPLRLKML